MQKSKPTTNLICNFLAVTNFITPRKLSRKSKNIEKQRRVMHLSSYLLPCVEEISHCSHL